MSSDLQTFVDECNHFRTKVVQDLEKIRRVLEAILLVAFSLGWFTFCSFDMSIGTISVEAFTFFNG